jgi:hypothetical protein
MNTRKLFYGILTCVILMGVGCTTDSDDLYESGVDKSKVRINNAYSVDKSKVRINNDTQSVEKQKVRRSNKQHHN